MPSTVTYAKFRGSFKPFLSPKPSKAFTVPKDESRFNRSDWLRAGVRPEMWRRFVTTASIQKSKCCCAAARPGPLNQTTTAWFTFSSHSTDPPPQSMHSTPFNVAGMSASTGAHHNHGPTAWSGTTSGGPLSTSLSDTLSQSLSRTQYQPGYLMVSTICISFLLPSSYRWSSPRPRTMSYSFSRDHN